MYRQDIGMEFGIEKCAMLVMKGGKRHMTGRVELPNQVVLRTLGEKEMKEKKLKKSMSEESENYSRQNLPQEPYQMDK